ncbi:MAG TPA: FtsX-like permease family protein [Candidatus Limnocylindrales bacterium]
MAWILTSLKRLRDERATAAGFALLILVTATLAAGAPRAFARLGDDTLRAELAARTPSERNIQFVEVDRLPAGQTDPLVNVTGEGAAIDATVPREVEALVSRREVLVESVRFSVSTPHPGDPTTLRLRIQPAAQDRLHLTAGRMPTGEVDRVDQTTVLEVALSNTNARTLNVALGGTVALQTDVGDTLAMSPEEAASVNATVVGLFDVTNPDAPDWLGDPSLARPVVRRPGGDAQFLDMAGLLSPDAYGALLAIEPPSFVRTTYQEFIDPSRIRQRDVATLIPAFRRLEARYPSANPRPGAGAGMRTAIRPFLESETARWTAATALLTVAIVGPIAVAGAALGMVAVLAARRRRAALSLSRGRGASVTHVTLASVAEGLLLALPAAAIGAAIGSQVAPEDPLLVPALTGGAIAAIGVVLLTLATVPATGGPAAFGSGRQVSVPRPPTPRRLVFEGLIVLLAALGASLLRERGLRPDGTADPLIAAVPALVGVSAGLLALRLLPLPTRLLAWLARLRRGLVGVIAMRRAAGGAGAPVLLVLLATTTIGAFSSAALGYLDQAAEAAGWRSVGADIRVVASQGYLNRDYDFNSLPGVTASARMFTGIAAVVAKSAQPDMLVLDVESYEDVVSGTPAEVALPVDLFGPAAEPVPVVIARGLEERANGMQVGETLTTSVQGYTFQARVVGDLPAFPGVDSNAFMLVSEKQLRTLFPEAPLRPTTAFLRAPTSSQSAITQAVTSAMSQAVVTGRTELSAELREAPIVRAVRLGIAATAVVAAIYAALAVAAALALGGAARTTENAHLRTLGLSDGQALWTLLLEQVPPLAFAFVAGLVTGVGLLVLLLPGLRLERLLGVDVQVSPGLDPTLVAAMAIGILLVALVGLAAGLWLGRRGTAVAALRRGFE